jgi:hypothetical protein
MHREAIRLFNKPIPAFRFAHPEHKQSVWLFLHLKKTFLGNRRMMVGYKWPLKK